MLQNERRSDKYKMTLDGKEWRYSLISNADHSEYGIEIKDLQNGTVSFSCRDLSEEKDLVVNLLLLMAEQEVHPYHAMDVIQDYIADYYTVQYDKKLQ